TDCPHPSLVLKLPQPIYHLPRLFHTGISFGKDAQISEVFTALYKRPKPSPCLPRLRRTSIFLDKYHKIEEVVAVFQPLPLYPTSLGRRSFDEPKIEPSKLIFDG